MQLQSSLLCSQEKLHSGNNFLYGYVSLHMFKITLSKKVGKIQYITTFLYQMDSIRSHKVNSYTMTILCASFLKILHAMEFV